jgi:hypothetical protein
MIIEKVMEEIIQQINFIVLTANLFMLSSQMHEHAKDLYFFFQIDTDYSLMVLKFWRII